MSKKDFSRFMKARGKTTVEDISKATQERNSYHKKERDPLIIKLPLTNKEGTMIVRLLPNKFAGENGPESDVSYDAPWFVKRLQHHFSYDGTKETNVFFDCPKSLDNKASCAVCDQSWEWYHDGEEELWKASKAKNHFFSWVLVKSVDGKEDHEWVDGKPRILFYKNQVMQVLEKALGIKRKVGKNKKTAVKPGKPGAVKKETKSFLFYEMADAYDVDTEKTLPCQGRDLWLNCEVEGKWATYLSEDSPTSFLDVSYPIVKSDEDYDRIVNNIVPLEDKILNDHKFNTMEEMQDRLDIALGVDKEDSSDEPDDTEDSTEDVENEGAVSDRIERESETTDDSESNDERKKRLLGDI